MSRKHFNLISLFFLLWVHKVLLPACAEAADTPGCRLAKTLVEKAKTAVSQPNPNYNQIFMDMRTAQGQCRSEKEIYPLLVCSAAAIGDSAAERSARRQAVTLGIPEIICAEKSGVRVPPKPLPTHVRTKWALIVGIGNFADSRIPTLKYTAADANDFAAFLVGEAAFPAGNVVTLTDERATRSSILTQLNKISKDCTEDDLVVVYLSTHGSPKVDSSGSTLRGLDSAGFIITHDANLDSLSVDGLSFESFAKSMQYLPARRVVLFLDTCFSGEAAASMGSKSMLFDAGGPGGVSKAAAEMFLSGDGFYVITSSRDDQKSWESSTLENSYFTHYLIEALRQKDGGKPVTVNQAYEFLKARVAKAVREEKNAQQEPQMVNTGEGEVRIGVLPKLDEFVPSS